MQQMRMHASQYRTGEHALMPELNRTFVSRHRLAPFYRGHSKQTVRQEEGTKLTI